VRKRRVETYCFPKRLKRCACLPLYKAGRRFPLVNRLTAQLFTFKYSGRPLTRRAFLCPFEKLLSGQSESWPLNPLRSEESGHLLTGFLRSCFL